MPVKPETIVTVVDPGTVTAEGKTIVAVEVEPSAPRLEEVNPTFHVVAAPAEALLSVKFTALGVVAAVKVIPVFWLSAIGVPAAEVYIQKPVVG